MTAATIVPQRLASLWVSHNFGVASQTRSQGSFQINGQVKHALNFRARGVRIARSVVKETQLCTGRQ